MTPPCLPHKLRSQVISACDLHIIDVVDILKPSVIMAVGGFTFEQVTFKMQNFDFAVILSEFGARYDKTKRSLFLNIKSNIDTPEGW